MLPGDTDRVDAPKRPGRKPASLRHNDHEILLQAPLHNDFAVAPSSTPLPAERRMATGRLARDRKRYTKMETSFRSRVLNS